MFTVPLTDISITNTEITSVMDALAKKQVSGTGPHIPALGKAIAAKIGRRFVLPVMNGTCALELALLSLGIGIGDEVLVPALSFIAPAAAVKAVGATPIYVDSDPDTWTMDPTRVQALITKRTKAMIPVDVYGYPADYDALAKFGIPIIEDACESHGATYKGKPAGSFGIISVFSFHASKVISFGEGGAICTDDEELFARICMIANHGMPPGTHYVHTLPGHNFRMPNLVAAFGLA